MRLNSARRSLLIRSLDSATEHDTSLVGDGVSNRQKAHLRETPTPHGLPRPMICPHAPRDARHHRFRGRATPLRPLLAATSRQRRPDTGDVASPGRRRRLGHRGDWLVDGGPRVRSRVRPHPAQVGDASVPRGVVHPPTRSGCRRPNDPLAPRTGPTGRVTHRRRPRRSRVARPRLLSVSRPRQLPPGDSVLRRRRRGTRRIPDHRGQFVRLFRPVRSSGGSRREDRPTDAQTTRNARC